MTTSRRPLPGEATPDAALDVFEVRDEAGVRFRISRYFSADGTRWVRHGPFVMFHPNGRVATEGEYRDGLEVGTWRDFYEDGRLAAEGMYSQGREIGYWQFWSRDGTEGPPIEYADGEAVATGGEV